MNREEAEEYAKNMSYRDAVYNALQGKSIPYRKATIIKLNELVNRLEPKNLPEIPVVVYPPITKKIEIVHCSECTFFNNGFCTQYDMEADEHDGCSNYELIRGCDNGD